MVSEKMNYDSLDMKQLKMSTRYSITEHSNFWILISPALRVKLHMQLYNQPNI